MLYNLIQNQMATKAKYHRYTHDLYLSWLSFFGKVLLLKGTYSAGVKAICSSRLGSHVHIEE
jgi:hypothetical protein